MNEHIDTLLTVSKISTRNNPWAHFATQAFSMGYNVSMLWGYNYHLAVGQSIGPGCLTAEQIQTYNQERLKHTLLLGMECAALIVAGVGVLCESRR